MKEFIDRVLIDARSQNKWLDKPLPEGVLEEIYDITKWGPTSGNCCPMRIIFCTTAAAKERLAEHAMGNNPQKITSAPAVAILGFDLDFRNTLSKLFPHDPEPFIKRYESNEKMNEATAFRNGTLQAAYFMIAARALGLDVGPMSGFNNKAVDDDFFGGTNVKSNFICGIGFGDPEGVFGRLPRLGFDDACQVI